MVTQSEFIYNFMLLLLYREMKFRDTVSELLRKRRRCFKRRCVRFLALQMHRPRNECAILWQPPTKRILWKKVRSDHWWNVIVLQNFGDSEWIDNFRMRKDTFLFICSELQSVLSPATDTVRAPLSLEKRVAVAIYKLATCGEYRVVANQFGIHKSTVHKCLYAFVRAVNSILLPKFIKMPDRDEADALSNQFCAMTGFPQVIGAIDGTHIPILAPKEGYSDFLNRKGWTSVVLQAVVDCHYCFRNVTISHPGNVHDATVFKDSSLYKMASRVMPTAPQTINGTAVPKLILGDAAYPLLTWLMKPYTGRTMTPEEESFGVYLSSTRIVVENAFGRLKARWRCLAKRQDTDYRFVPQVISACCVLHNIIEMHKDRFRDTWLSEVDRGNQMFPQPGGSSCAEADESAEEIRKCLVHYFSNFPLRRSRLRFD